MQTGQRVRITKEGAFKDQMATVTKVKGPRTVEIKTDSGVMLWNVKIAKLVPADV